MENKDVRLISFAILIEFTLFFGIVYKWQPIHILYSLLFLVSLYIIIALMYGDFKLFSHKCNFIDGKAIASRYISFGTRDIVRECKCGKRAINREYYQYGDPLPIPTNILISHKELEAFLTNP